MRRMTFGFAVMLTFLCGVGQVFGQTVETLDEPEQLAMSDTLQNALEYNPTSHVSNWVNPDTEHSGSVVPVKTYTNELGQPCREFITTIIIGGQEEQGYGTACRQPDGSWQIVTGEETTTSSPPAPTNVYVQTPPERYHYIYPDAYYYYPSSFYYPYNIYLSFSYIYRGGAFFYGSYFLDYDRFYRRYPVHVRTRVYWGPRIFNRHRWYYHPPVHYRTPVRKPVYRNRYDSRRPDSRSPVYRQRQENRQQRDLRNQDRNRQSPGVRRPSQPQREQRKMPQLRQGGDVRNQQRGGQPQGKRQTPAIRYEKQRSVQQKTQRSVQRKPPVVRGNTGVRQDRAKGQATREQPRSHQGGERQSNFGYREGSRHR